MRYFIIRCRRLMANDLPRQRLARANGWSTRSQNTRQCETEHRSKELSCDRTSKLWMPMDNPWSTTETRHASELSNSQERKTVNEEVSHYSCLFRSRDRYMIHWRLATSLEPSHFLPRMDNEFPSLVALHVHPRGRCPSPSSHRHTSHFAVVDLRETRAPCPSFICACEGKVSLPFH